ncbi:OmpA family protein [Chlamydiales bacterium]|nr:OmpA family protein [Chlamydiales bacterium]
MFRCLIFFSLFTVIFSSCCRTTDEVWDDTVSCSRHVNRGFASLCGTKGDSRQVQSRDDFWYTDGNQSPYFDGLWDDYDTQEIAMNDMEAPKHEGSIPGIQGFSNPSSDPSLSKIFKKIHFEYNSNAITGKENLETVQSIANYMKQHPNTFIFIEGHCDARGPEAYNLALGSRRSNELRSYLVKEGVDADHLFTISYGKERLAANGNDNEAHKLNRRGEFKLYDR